jgi:chromosome segregation ATPase
MEDEKPAEAGARWMTYKELAATLGVSLPAAEARVRRNKWRKQEGNDGTLRVSVPPDVLLPSPAAQRSPQADELRSAHEATVAELRRRAEAAEAAATDARALADQRAGEMASMARELGQAGAERDAALRRADATEARLATIEAEARKLTNLHAEGTAQLREKTVQTEAAETARRAAEAERERAEAKLALAEAELRESRRPLWNRVIRAIRQRG